MKKTAVTKTPIHPLLAERWSPRAFADRVIDAPTFHGLFEAARWAPSCFNAQPWRFLAARRHADPEGFERIASVLVDANGWAKQAGALVLAVARNAFEYNDKPNRHAWHDVGLALGNLTVEAESRGLAVHQMAGFDADAARETFSIPAAFEATTAIAIGYPGSADDLPDPLADRERAPRERKALDEVAFGAAWESPLS